MAGASLYESSTEKIKGDTIEHAAPIPGPATPEIAHFIEEVRYDALRRRDAGGHEPPAAAIAAVKRLRLGAARLPRHEGGGGWTLAELVRFLVTLAAADPDVPHILRLHFAFVEDLLRVPATESKTRWRPEVLRGKLFGGALSEINTHQVDGARFDTHLTPQPDNTFRLSGRKFYTTGARYCDYLRVVAQLPDAGTQAVMVPASREGVVFVDDWDGIGQRHTASGTTRFDHVLISPDEVLSFYDRSVDARPRQAFMQLYLSVIAAGIMRSLLSDAAELPRTRKRTFSYASATEPRHDPQVLGVVGTIAAATFAVQAILDSATTTLERAIDTSQTTGIDPDLEDAAALAAAHAKVGIEPIALAAATSIFDAGGATAVRSSAHIDRHWRNLRTLFSHNPTIYKAHALGDLAVNDTPLPASGFF